MNRYWSETVRQLVPYVPGEQPKIPDLIKLNTNENPYGPSPAALQAMQAAVNDALRLYPDPASDALRDVIAGEHGVGRDNVFVGNGSDEVLAHAFHALLKQDLPVFFPDVTYSFYPVYCQLYGIAYQHIPLDADLRIQVDEYIKPNGGIVFANPNAPTGCELPLKQIEFLLQRNSDSVVLVDEAYVDFGAASAVSLIRRFPQLLVVRTLSKSHGLAGLRVGYAVGDAGLIEGLRRVKDSFNSYPLGRIAQAGAQAAIADRVWFESARQRIITSRQRLVTKLQSMGFEVLPSAANFVLARHAAYAGAQLAKMLRQRNILVRHFSRPTRIDAFIRITIGTDEQCQALVDALQNMGANHEQSVSTI